MFVVFRKLSLESPIPIPGPNEIVQLQRLGGRVVLGVLGCQGQRSVYSGCRLPDGKVVSPLFGFDKPARRGWLERVGRPRGKGRGWRTSSLRRWRPISGHAGIEASAQVTCQHTHVLVWQVGYGVAWGCGVDARKRSRKRHRKDTLKTRSRGRTRTRVKVSRRCLKPSASSIIRNW